MGKPDVVGRLPGLGASTCSRYPEKPGVQSAPVVFTAAARVMGLDLPQVFMIFRQTVLQQTDVFTCLGVSALRQLKHNTGITLPRHAIPSLLSLSSA